MLGKAKVEPYARMLLGELGTHNKKHVVFCVHDEPLEYLEAFLRKHNVPVVSVSGKTPEQDRQQAVDDFMQKPDVRVFIGKIRVAGVGLTLTEADAIDMLESDWTPAGNAQAIKRVHRIGQTQQVHARFITLANSFDVTVNEVVARKTRDIAQIEQREIVAALQ